MFDVLSLYRLAPLSARIHINLRWRLFPFASLEPYIPDNGKMIDLGCGHGLWALLLAHLRPQASILGIDPDQQKIKIAREVASSAGLGNVQFEVGHLQDIALPDCNLVTLIDVMYVIPFELQAQAVESISACLQSGGKLLIKEMSFTPAWKFSLNRIEEWVAVRVLRITHGAKFYFRDEASWSRLLADTGMRVKSVRLDFGYLHPHLLFIGEKI